MTNYSDLFCNGQSVEIIDPSVQREVIEIQDCCGGAGGGGGIETISGTINPSEDKPVDINLASTFLASDYIVAIYNTSQLKYRKFCVSLMKTATDTQDSVYNKLGDALAINVQTVINGGNIELKIRNDEAYSLSYKIIKLKI